MSNTYSTSWLASGEITPQARAFFEATRASFQQSRGNDEAAAHWWADAVTDQQRLRACYDPSDASVPGALTDWPVANFVSSDGLVHVGAGRQLVSNYVMDIGTRTTHRRRGLMSELMRIDLREAVERGVPLASLTASQGSIYQRFGFGIATRRSQATVTTSHFALAQPPAGRVVMVDPVGAIDTVLDFNRAWEQQHFLAHSRVAWMRDFLSGRWYQFTQAPITDLRTVLHLDDGGTVDGYSIFVPNEDTRIASVYDLAGLNAAAELSLWDYLGHLELIDTINVSNFDAEGPLPWALVNPRSVSVTGSKDHLWLRILDVPTALSAREWTTQGQLLIGVEDALGFAAGCWRVEVSASGCQVAASQAEPEIILDASTLASLYSGLVRARTLADAGRITGSQDAIARCDTLFQRDDAPRSLAGF